MAEGHPWKISQEDAEVARPRSLTQWGTFPLDPVGQERVLLPSGVKQPHGSLAAAWGTESYCLDCGRQQRHWRDRHTRDAIESNRSIALWGVLEAGTDNP